MARRTSAALAALVAFFTLLNMWMFGLLDDDERRRQAWVLLKIDAEAPANGTPREAEPAREPEPAREARDEAPDASEISFPSPNDGTNSSLPRRREVYSILRPDRSGAVAMDMLLASARAYESDAAYKGACGPAKKQTVHLLETMNLQTIRSAWRSGTCPCSAPSWTTESLEWHKEKQPFCKASPG